MFAKRLDAFHGLRRKAVRVIQYRADGRTETLKEQGGTKGYACGLEELVGYIHGLLPANEVIEQALRRSVPMFPELAVRELVANALIHQDFFITGSGPMTTDTSERGLERLICTALAGSPCDPASPGTGATGEVRERPASTERGGSAAPPRTTTAQIWPRYHQLDVVRRLLADIARHGAARRTLVQHSAGSGKSNSIAWLAHQLIELAKDGAVVFDSIIVVTDRRILDQQIKDTIKQFMDNESFRRWLTDTIFGLTYKGPAAGGLTSRDVLSNKCRVDCGTGWRLERGRRLVLGGAGAAARRPWMRSSNAAWCTSRART